MHKGKNDERSKNGVQIARPCTTDGNEKRYKVPDEAKRVHAATAPWGTGGPKASHLDDQKCSAAAGRDLNVQCKADDMNLN